MMQNSNISILAPRVVPICGQDELIDAFHAQPNVRIHHPEPMYGSYSLAQFTAPRLVVVTHYPGSRGDWQLVTKLPKSTKLVVHLHHWWTTFDRIEHSRIEQALERASMGIAPTQFLADDMAKRFPKVRWEVLPSGRPADTFHPASDEDRKSFRSIRGLPIDGFVAAYIGRLDLSNGLQVLRKLAKIIPGNATLIVQYPVGRGKYARETNHLAQELTALSRRRIMLCPDTNLKSPRPIVYADMLLATSLSEAAPLSAIESILSGVPIVAANSTPYYSELIKRGVPESLLQIIEIPQSSSAANVLYRRQLLSDRDANSLAESFAAAVEWRMNNRLDMSEKTGAALAAKAAELDEESMVKAAIHLYCNALA